MTIKFRGTINLFILNEVLINLEIEIYGCGLDGLNFITNDQELSAFRSPSLYLFQQYKLHLLNNDFIFLSLNYGIVWDCLIKRNLYS